MTAIMTMQDRIANGDSPTDADMAELRRKAELGGEYPVMEPNQLGWILDEIEYLRGELSQVRNAATTASDSIKAVLADLASEL